MDCEQLVFSQSFIYLTKVRIADVFSFVDSFHGAVKTSKLDKGYKFLDVCFKHKVPFINGMALDNFSHST